MRRLFGLLCLLAFLPLAWCDVQVVNLEVKPRYPWNGLVDIVYEVRCGETDADGNPKDIFIELTGYDGVLDREIKMTSLTGDGVVAPVKTGGPYKVTWDAAKDYPSLNTSAFQVKIRACIPLYMVVDISGAQNVTNYPVRYTSNPPDLTNDTCRTTELWLRLIPAGTFMMGSPEYEDGRQSNEVQHEVTITKPFYIGVFECTQRQYQLIIGGSPSYFKGDCRPVEQVSYNDIRGSSTGAGWPGNGHAVDGTSFMGKLQGRTGKVFDLPTEAQWEYACRAGTKTAFYSGSNIEGRYGENKSEGKGGYTDAHTKVGSYAANAWGLYDMHGNVWEWCLDWYGNYDTSVKNDPKGASSGSTRVARSGSWPDFVSRVRSAFRSNNSPSDCNYYHGFRVVCCP